MAPADPPETLERVARLQKLIRTVKRERNILAAQVDNQSSLLSAWIRLGEVDYPRRQRWEKLIRTMKRQLTALQNRINSYSSELASLLIR